MGSVQKLENGCYLIVCSNQQKIVILDAEGKQVDTIFIQGPVYRANAYPKDWLK